MSSAVLPDPRLATDYLRDVTVRPVRDPDDWCRVADLRLAGYHRFYTSAHETVSARDAASHSVCYLAEDQAGVALGTIRILTGEIEAGDFIDLASLLGDGKGHPCEATRFVVTRGPHRMAVKMLLWKTFFLHAGAHHASTMVVWSRPGGLREYSRLMFRPIEPGGLFAHPALGGRPHTVLSLDVRTAPQLYQESDHALYRFFVEEHHPNLLIETHGKR